MLNIRNNHLRIDAMSPGSVQRAFPSFRQTLGLMKRLGPYLRTRDFRTLEASRKLRNRNSAYAENVRTLQLKDREFAITVRLIGAFEGKRIQGACGQRACAILKGMFSGKSFG